MLRELRVGLRHFRYFVQFIQTHFGIQRIATTRIDDLDILDGNIRKTIQAVDGGQVENVVVDSLRSINTGNPI